MKFNTDTIRQQISFDKYSLAYYKTQIYRDHKYFLSSLRLVIDIVEVRKFEDDQDTLAGPGFRNQNAML